MLAGGRDPYPDVVPRPFSFIDNLRWTSSKYGCQHQLKKKLRTLFYIVCLCLRLEIGLLLFSWSIKPREGLQSCLGDSVTLTTRLKGLGVGNQEIPLLKPPRGLHVTLLSQN